MANILPPINHSFKKHLRLAVTVIPLGAWSFFLYKQYGQLQNYKWEFSFTNLSFSLFFATLYFILLALGWALLLQNMTCEKGAHYLSPLPAMEVWLRSIMSRYIPGNVWHIMNRIAFAERLKVGRIQILASSTIEQGLAIVGATLTSAISFPFWPLSRMSGQYLHIAILLFFLVFGLAVLHPRVLQPILRWASTKFRKPQLNWKFNYSTIISLILLYALAAITAGLTLSAVMAGLGELKSTHIIFLIGSSALAWVVGYLSFVTPSGIGVREGVLTILLSIVYPLPIAIISSLLFRILCTIGELLALVSFLFINSVFSPTESFKSNEHE